MTDTKSTQSSLCKGATGAALFLAAAALLCCLNPYQKSSNLVSSFRESQPYYQYVHQPKEEMLKLFLVMDQFKNTKFKVIYEGHEYDINLALLKAKRFLNTHYKNEKADQWVQVNLYRSQSKGEIIYLKYPDGKLRPLRDVLIEELHLLQSASR